MVRVGDHTVAPERLQWMRRQKVSAVTKVKEREMREHVWY
jgi:hypothetical protein